MVEVVDHIEDSARSNVPVNLSLLMAQDTFIIHTAGVVIDDDVFHTHKTITTTKQARTKLDNNKPV